MADERDSNEPEGTPPAADELLREHEYDGIREYDNPMPLWWKRIFHYSFWFSVAYLVWFWVSGRGLGVVEEYEEDARAAAAREAAMAINEAATEESLSKLVQDRVTTGKGKELFVAKCVQCHGEQGQGVIGPNLTDDSWIHGSGTLLDLYGVVNEGVAAKGMPAWGRQLRPDELKQVVAFVGTLRGTHVAGKSAEGTPTPRGR